jgi:hypothetical protein
MKKSNKIFWSGVAAGWAVLFILLLSAFRFNTVACAAGNTINHPGAMNISLPVGK